MRSIVVALVFLVFVAGCSGGSETTQRSGVLFDPCAEGTEVGTFSIWVSASSNGGASVFNGVVWNGPTVPDYRRPLPSESECTLMVPDLAMASTSVTQDVGTVEISGLLGGVTRSFLPVDPEYRAYTSNPGDLPYPAAEPGAAVFLRAAGGAHAPFTLEGRGFAPLPAITGTQLTVARGQPVALAWDQPVAPVTTRLFASMYLGGDDSLDGGGLPGAGRITCSFPDTGAGTIPASLIDQLIDQGVNTRPLLTLRRVTVSSMQIAHGCVSFSMVTPSSQAIVVSP